MFFSKSSFLILAIAVVATLILTASPASRSQTAEAVKGNEEQMRKSMQEISRQLGTTCIECHDTKDFSANKKRQFQVAKDHLRLTQLLIDHGMDGTKGNPKADCYMCHRGKLVPDYKENISPLIRF